MTTCAGLKRNFRDLNQKPVGDIRLQSFSQGALGWATEARAVHSPMNGGQFGRFPANSDLRAVQVGFGPGLVDGEESVAMTFEPSPEQGTQ